MRPAVVIRAAWRPEGFWAGYGWGVIAMIVIWPASGP